jgi:hypothetical protein
MTQAGIHSTQQFTVTLATALPPSAVCIAARTFPVCTRGRGELASFSRSQSERAVSPCTTTSHHSHTGYVPSRRVAGDAPAVAASAAPHHRAKPCAPHSAPRTGLAGMRAMRCVRRPAPVALAGGSSWLSVLLSSKGMERDSRRGKGSTVRPHRLYICRTFVVRRAWTAHCSLPNAP